MELHRTRLARAIFRRGPETMRADAEALYFGEADRQERVPRNHVLEVVRRRGVFWDSICVRWESDGHLSTRTLRGVRRRDSRRFVDVWHTLARYDAVVAAERAFDA